MRKIMITVVASLHLIACAPVAQVKEPQKQLVTIHLGPEVSDEVALKDLQNELSIAQDKLIFQDKEVTLHKVQPFQGGLYLNGKSLFLVLKNSTIENGKAYMLKKKGAVEISIAMGIVARNNAISLGIDEEERGELSVVELESDKEVLKLKIE